MTNKVMVVAGARPNFIKVAPIISELERRLVSTIFVHTGQHYDARMSQEILEDIGLRDPDHSLEIGSGSHAEQTARIMLAFEPVLVAERPRWLVVVGDVNSTIACALVASKLKHELRCKVAHVEAGLRSSDWQMPEEINRVLTDRLSDALLIPSPDARANLLIEGIDPASITFVGNVMIDTLLATLDRARARDLRLRIVGDDESYALMTLHRPSNVDEPKALATILQAMNQVADEMNVVFPVHPRTFKNIERFGLVELTQGLTILPPARYIEMVALMADARVVLTDSGGVQEETTALGVPCVTLRQSTERPITITEGTNELAPWPLSSDGIVSAFRRGVQRASARMPVRRPDGWDGHAASRIADVVTVLT